MKADIEPDMFTNLLGKDSKTSTRKKSTKPKKKAPTSTTRSWQKKCRKRKDPEWCRKLIAEMLTKKKRKELGVTLSAAEKSKVSKYCSKNKKIANCLINQEAYYLNERYGIKQIGNKTRDAPESRAYLGHIIGGVVAVIIILFVALLSVFCFAGGHCRGPKKKTRFGRGVCKSSRKSLPKKSTKSSKSKKTSSKRGKQQLNKSTKSRKSKQKSSKK